jgi:hypothetical protein
MLDPHLLHPCSLQKSSMNLSAGGYKKTRSR